MQSSPPASQGSGISRVTGITSADRVSKAHRFITSTLISHETSTPKSDTVHLLVHSESRLSSLQQRITALSLLKQGANPPQTSKSQQNPSKILTTLSPSQQIPYPMEPLPSSKRPSQRCFSPSKCTHTHTDHHRLIQRDVQPRVRPS
jgi:hypothetical protein